MKKKIIKKIILVIIPIMVFCIGMNDVKAISYIGENYKFSNSNYNECVDSQECILLCGYEQELDGSNTNVPIITYGSVYIYYFQSGRSSDDIKVTFNSNKSDLLQYNNNKIEWDGGTLAKTKNSGLCPTYGYSFNGDICFSNDKSFCEEKFNSKLPLTSVKKYDINNQIKEFYNNYKLDNDCNLINENTFTNHMQNEFVNKFLNGSGNLGIFKGTDSEYTLGIKKIKNQLETLKNSCISKVQEQEENGAISSEQAEEQIDNYNSQYKKIEMSIDNLSGNGDLDTSDSFVNCEDLLGEELVAKLNEYMTILRILIPIIVIALGSYDFAKAVFAQDENKMKESQKMFIRRLIIAVAIFFVPTVINILISLINTAWNEVVISNNNCM